MEVRKSILIAFVLFLSCAPTYLLTSESLQDQIKNATPFIGTFQYNPAINPLFYFKKIEYNGVKKLIVTDKKGKTKSFYVNNRTGIRITTKDGKTVTFYFDTLFIVDDQVVGQKSHFLNLPIKPIAFSDIIKIEVQPF